MSIDLEKIQQKIERILTATDSTLATTAATLLRLAPFAKTDAIKNNLETIFNSLTTERGNLTNLHKVNSHKSKNQTTPSWSLTSSANSQQNTTTNESLAQKQQEESETTTHARSLTS